MVAKSDLVRLEPCVYEIPIEKGRGMRVPARIYASEELLDAALSDRSIEQLANTATLPGIVKVALAMPDVHQGYGFPIGGIAATALPNGVISPGGVGYDINCGVRLLTTHIEAEALKPHMARLMAALFGQVPAGVGAAGSRGLSDKELRVVLEQGSDWAIKNGYGSAEDREHTEKRGRMEAANADALSARAMERGRDQVGTLGSGNHFLEVDEITEVCDPEIAQALGLVEGMACVWIHCGSRGLGHQVCTDAVRQMQRSMARYNIQVPDRELACVPFDSPEGQEYYQAMSCAANYAWANRQVITHRVRQVFEQTLAGLPGNKHLRLLYDVCHNVAQVEEHTVDGKKIKLCVHRKGATRAFGPGHPDVPSDYRRYGQPVLIPGDMGTGSYVLVGTDKAMRDTFGSSCHGAGRVASRSQARKSMRGEDLRRQLENEGITVRAGSMSGLAEEAPDAYKNLEQVVAVVHETGIARRIARTRPLGVIKG